MCTRIVCEADGWARHQETSFLLLESWYNRLYLSPVLEIRVIHISSRIFQCRVLAVLFAYILNVFK